ncbi:UDP-N-acetylmuramate dehydrogenase [Arsenicibacter rosenii]|uniref:UDP-N-acetylenolpyruvoylglucosamine reductase n=1 Tax=Arsenicibacter rosenii TaxID=1750698 RepID=A0A1S2VG48_9BACT|nr:UDP-N-acetylmuramate dehydrogenase [Arsenicibacter rosenii]OIN57694.1 UDP-N-acetylenolpyruvoylglucosamine reductase [Arsenicibacter rosenii]
MLTLQSNFSLKNYNTFGIDATARFGVEVHNLADLQTLLRSEEYQEMPKLILGGGSNVLFTKDVDGLVILMRIDGIDVVRESDTHYWVQAGAGVNWHQFVMYCVENKYAGLENLSLIPGTVGAAPMQNIGAYGVEIEQVFDSLTALHVESGELRQFNHEECRFGYRESVFKHDLKGQYIIASVTFRLAKQPTFHISYGAIQDTLAEMGVSAGDITIRDVSDAVIRIRRSKLPDPADIGNAGSFFKNPEIPTVQYQQLKLAYPAIPGYVVSETTTKVPAGWLIEQAGWKGYRDGDAGVHTKQALVLVNYGGANGHDLLSLATRIQTSVFDKFGITINPEVNVI